MKKIPSLILTSLLLTFPIFACEVEAPAPLTYAERFSAALSDVDNSKTGRFMIHLRDALRILYPCENGSEEQKMIQEIFERGGDFLATGLSLVNAGRSELGAFKVIHLLNTNNLLELFISISERISDSIFEKQEPYIWYILSIIQNLLQASTNREDIPDLITALTIVAISDVHGHALKDIADKTINLMRRKCSPPNLYEASPIINALRQVPMGKERDELYNQAMKTSRYIEARFILESYIAPEN